MPDSAFSVQILPRQWNSFNRVSIFALFFFVFIFCGCDNYCLLDANLLTSIHQQTTPNNAQPFTEGIDVYIDFSDGMHPAIQQANAEYRQALSLADSPTTQYFEVGTETNLKPKGKEQLRNPDLVSSFSDNVSKIDVPLQRIVKTNKQAILITDFELISDGITKEQYTPQGKFKTIINLSNWSKQFFADWLARDGNTLDIFAKPFTKTNSATKTKQNQHLYFLVFTPNELPADAEKIVSGLKRDFPGLPHFQFSRSNFNIVTDFTKNPTPTNNGLNEYVVLHNYIENPSEKFAYYQINFNDLGNLDQATTDKSILRYLYFDDNMMLYDNFQFTLEVTDLTDNLAAFCDSVAVGSEGSYKFSKAPADNQRFELVTNKLENNRYELLLYKHANFTSLDGLPKKIYKVDIKIASASLNLNEPAIDRVLRWNDARGFWVESLASSLKNVVRQDLKPNKSLLYTYYIEVQK